MIRFRFVVRITKRSFHWLPIIDSLMVFVQRKVISCSKKESGSNDILINFVEFLNVHNKDRASNVTQSNLSYNNICGDQNQLIKARLWLYL